MLRCVFSINEIYIYIYIYILFYHILSIKYKLDEHNPCSESNIGAKMSNDCGN